MKKNALVSLLFVLSSCTFYSNSSTSKNSISEESRVYISSNEVFNIKTPHFCYFFLSTCASCESIKSKIELYAKEHEDFYMVETPNSYQKGISREDNIGVKCVDDIKFLGFPTLVYIENCTLVKMYVGINEITNILF